MRSHLLSLALLGVFGVTSSAVLSAPIKLSKAQLDQVVAGKITEVHKNNGGNYPKGNAYGTPTVNQNPAGKEPPGQN